MIQFFRKIDLDKLFNYQFPYLFPLFHFKLTDSYFLKKINKNYICKVFYKIFLSFSYDCCSNIIQILCGVLVSKVIFCGKKTRGSSPLVPKIFLSLCSATSLPSTKHPLQP